LKKEVPGWDRFPQEARNELVEGERRLHEGIAHDHAPEVVCFAKAVEIILKVSVFDTYAKQCHLDMDIKKQIEFGLQDQFKQAHRFVRFIEKVDHLELGTMAAALRLCQGRTAQRVSLLGRFRVFIERKLLQPQLVKDSWLADLEALAKLRNLAAHARSFGESEARHARELACRMLAHMRE
jgi:hypothetical protein